MLEYGAKIESIYNVSLRMYTSEEAEHFVNSDFLKTVFPVPNKCIIKWNLHVLMSSLEFQNNIAHTCLLLEAI